MVVCFICGQQVYKKCTQVCSSLTPHCNVPYPEKIAELLGEEIVVIVTPADVMCKKCTSLLCHMDKLENDLKLVKNAILAYVKKNYGLLPSSQDANSVETDNEHLKAEEQLEQGQPEIHRDLTVGETSTATTAALQTPPLQTPLKFLKSQQQQQQQQQQKQPPTQQQQQRQHSPTQKQQQQQPQQPPKQQKQQKQQHPPTQQQQPPTRQKQQQQQQQQRPSTQQESASKIVIYKCSFCEIESKDLSYVRYHMRTHTNKNMSKKPVLKQAEVKALTPAPRQQKQVFQCQVCSGLFDSRLDCLHHIREDHSQSVSSRTHKEKETKVMKPGPSNAQENNQIAESPMDADENQLEDTKGTINMDMMLNDYVSTERSANLEQEINIENSQEDMIVEEAKLNIEPEVAKEEAAEEEEEKEKDEKNTIVLKKEEADQGAPDSIKVELDEDNANIETKTTNLDIESMLAPIHNDSPTNNKDSPNKA